MYDFQTFVNRREQGSIKWEIAKRVYRGDSERLVALSIADMDFLMPPAIVEAVRDAADRLVYGYTMPTQAYYDAVISWMSRRHSWQIEQSWIAVSPGIVAAINYAILAFTNQGDGIIVQMPVYRPFHASVADHQRKIINNALVRNGKRYEIDFDNLESCAALPDTKMLILCNPHNPIGRVWTYSDLEKIAAICTRHNVMVVSDEIHCDIVFKPNVHTSYGHLPRELRQNSIVCTSPSKTFNMCGLQVSNNIIENSGIRERFKKTANNCGFHGLNCFAGVAGIAAYNESEDWLDEFLQVIEDNHKMVSDFTTKQLPKLEVFPLEATYLQWLNFAAFSFSTFDRERLLHENGIFFESGHIFGEGGETFERLNLAYPKTVLNAVMNRLAEIM
ncbi:MAG: pyridoxal phosphate-dependent aminotransferase [Planctomycetaceae bacterium]|jgi:putative C-S lyase|nr:pyridoxal phosphate-dependent aminotransferase [Planctomycetaceae bacterium]